ncbi:MAG: histidine phosphatase family protein [Solirubrobacteraceae bacterium]
MAKYLNVIRHTTPDIKKGILYGQTDLGIVDSFYDEVNEIKRNNIFLNNNEIVFSSPLKRCKVLAQELFSQDIIFDSRLKELNFGDWEMLPFEKVGEKNLVEWRNDIVNTRPPNGESIKDLSIRVHEFLEDLKKIENQTINIIAHAGVIKVISLYCLNEPLERFEFKMNYGEFFQFELT